MATPLVVVAGMFGWKEGWLEKVALMDVEIQLPQVVWKYLVCLWEKMWSQASPNFYRIDTILAKQFFCIIF